MSKKPNNLKVIEAELPTSDDIANEIARLSELYDDLKEKERSKANQDIEDSSNRENKRLRKLLDDAQDKLYLSEKSSKDKLNSLEVDFKQKLEQETYINEKLHRQVARLEKDLEIEKNSRIQERKTAKRTLDTSYNHHDIQVKNLEMQLESSQRQVEEITESLEKQARRLEKQLKIEQDARTNDKVSAKRLLEKEYEQNDNQIKQLEKSIEDQKIGHEIEINGLQTLNLTLSKEIEELKTEQLRNDKLLQKTREELHHTHTTYQRQLQHLENEIKLLQK